MISSGVSDWVQVKKIHYNYAERGGTPGGGGEDFLVFIKFV